MPSVWRAIYTPDGAKTERRREDCRHGRKGGVSPRLSASGTSRQRHCHGTAEKATEQLGDEFREAARVLRHQAYGDDATTRAEEAMRPNQPEAWECRSGQREKEMWTYVQRIRTGVEGQGVELKVMFDNNTPHTLILNTAAARAALDPMWKRKLVMSPDSGEPEESLCKYFVPLVDWQGNTHLLKAGGVDYTIYAGERKVPPKAATIFPEMEGKASPPGGGNG
jgi:hypothetical protein